MSAPGLLVGATDYCTHPADLDVTRVGGSKYPDLAAVRALRPDLVLANEEENREQDVLALRAAGITVWVCFPRTVPEAVEQLRAMFAVLGVPAPAWVDRAEAVWREPVPRRPVRALIPVWRRPWVVLGRDTFAGDVLARLGVGNLYTDAADRYPRPPLAELRQRRPELLVLPDEPYAFTDADGPQYFPGVVYALVSGRHLTWYGPSLVDARSVLAGQLAGRRQR